MGAPTWPPDPEKAFALTAEEYGISPQSIGADEEDEEAERALLAAFLFRPPERQLVSGQQVGASLVEVQRCLNATLRMLSGRDVALAASDPATTDGRRIFLPRAVPAPREDEDLLLFRAMGLVQLGLLHFGLLDSPAVLGELHRDWVLRSCFHLLATRHVVARWSASLPGVAADFRSLRSMDKAGIMRVNLTEVPREGMPGPFQPLYEGLTTCLNWTPPGPEGEPARRAVAAVAALSARQRPALAPQLDADDGAGARTVILGQAQRLRLVFRRMRLGPPPLPYFAGLLRPEWLLADLARDRNYEEAWRRGPAPLRQLQAAKARQGAAPQPAVGERRRPRPSLRQRIKRRLKRGLQGPGDPAELARAPAYGALRDEHQQEAEKQDGPARWRPDLPMEALLAEAEAALPEDEEGTRHDEWDDDAGIYRIAATRVLERPAHSGPLSSYERLVAANQHRIAQVRRQFEALRIEERWLHGQQDGSELDLDRAITAICDLRAGCDPDRHIWKRFQRQRQQVAILTLVDLSGSTQGHVIHLEQEALVLFAEGLRTLRLPHAFHGFHNEGPENCWLERIKGFQEGYDEAVCKRLANLRPGGATRMGAFIRHASLLLERQPQGRRILMVLSDGRPEDRDPYRGAYGIRDTAMAVQEAARCGIHVHCVSLDPAPDAPDWLEKVFGPRRFLTLKQVDQLPQRLPEVFRSLIR